jgi:hypothetical protein
MEQTGKGIWILSKNTIYIYIETKTGTQINDKNTVTKKQNLQHTCTIRKQMDGIIAPNIIYIAHYLWQSVCTKQL